MISEANGHGLWHYLGTFVLYTTLSIAFIYGMFLALKKNPAWLGVLTGRHTAASKSALAIETSLPLEARKSLHIVRCGQERFLIATGGDGTQFLSKLPDAELVSEPLTPVSNPEPSKSPFSFPILKAFLP